MESSEERTRIMRISMRIGEKTRFARIWPSAARIGVFGGSIRRFRANLRNIGVRIACPLRLSILHFVCHSGHSLIIECCRSKLSCKQSVSFRSHSIFICSNDMFWSKDRRWTCRSQCYIVSVIKPTNVPIMYAQRALRIILLSRGKNPDLPWCLEFPWSFSKQGNSLVFRVFSAAFPCFSSGFRGLEGVKNPWCLRWFSLVLPKHQGKEDQGIVSPLSRDNLRFLPQIWKGGKRPHPQLPGPKISALLRKRPVLLRADFVLTKDRKRPYYVQFCGKMHREGHPREGSCSRAAGGP